MVTKMEGEGTHATCDRSGMRVATGRKRSRAAILRPEQFGLSSPEVVKLYEALPLKEAVVEKWLYGNAKRVLRLD